MKLRKYQIEIANKANEKIKELGMVYIVSEVRTGKTLMALETAKLLNKSKVLFLTKKKAIKSITDDYTNFNYSFELVVINNESLHKVLDKDFDLIISDEHHRASAYPKPNTNAKQIKQKFGSIDFIFLSGTPSIESYSQWYHSFYVSNRSPFKLYTNFYKWAKDYVNIKKKYLGYAEVNDYSEANETKIDKVIGNYIIRFTQKQAGFNTEVKQNVLYCDMKPVTKNLINKLTKDLVVIGKDEKIIADTAVKLQSKVHQLSSGTIKFDSGNSQTIDNSKILFIQEYFKGKKLAIFYYFKEEYKMIKEIYNDSVTNDLEEFNTTNKHIALQQYSGAEGISLKEADILVYMNFGFSGSKFVQSLDRLTTMERKTNDVYFIFGKNGIEQKIYNAVKEKQNYSIQLFKKDYGFKISK
jgi:hypothetical protein